MPRAGIVLEASSQSSSRVSLKKKEGALFVNLGARRGAEWFGQAKDLLAQRGISLVKAEGFTEASALDAAVGAAVKETLPLVIVGGGDGTISLAVKHFIGSSSALGILPLGTGNSLARDLGIKADLSAIDVVAGGKVVNVDVGVINGEHFVNVATVGISTRIAAQLTDEKKRRLGRLAYGAALCRAIPGLKPFLATIKTELGQETFRTLQVVIGVGKYHAGPFLLAPDASITDGRLRVYALSDCSVWTLVKYALALPGGRFTQLREVASEAVTGGELETMPIRRVTVDGEIRMETPIKFRILPHALPVVVPQEFGE